MAFSLKKLSLPALKPFRNGEAYVALDIGSSSIKMVETVKDKAGFRLLHVGSAPLPPTAVQNNMVMERSVVAGAIQSLVREHRVEAAQAISSVPGRAVMVKKIQLPIQSEEELEGNIEFEAANVIPESLENVNLDYQILHDIEDGSKMEVLLVAVKKEIINSYTQAIQEAKLTPAIIDVDYFAMENMFEISYEPKPEEVVGLIHIGARYTSMDILRNGVSTFTGDLPVGGEAFTEHLAEQFKISYDEAEKAKLSGQLDGKKLDLDTLLQPVSQSLIGDVGRTLSLYGTMAGEGGIHAIFLSGGGAKVAGLCPLLEARLNVPVKLCDPFRGFTVGRNIDRNILSESALSLAVGAGLSIRRPKDK
jgi:type IV pilus assembly protein PilM